MSIIRTVKRETPFVQIDKSCLEDTSLSWKAKGLLAYLLSRPDDWKVYIEDLKSRSTDGRDSIYSGLKELTEAKYIVKKRLHDKSGKFAGWEYQVFEHPQIDESIIEESIPTENGKSEYGKSEYGKTVYGNSDTTNININNINLTNNDLTNINSLKDFCKNNFQTISSNEETKAFVNLLKQIDDIPEIKSSVLEKYIDTIRLTRATCKISTNVVINLIEKFSKYEIDLIHFAMLTHITSHEDKKEQYTLGIMRNTNIHEARRRLMKLINKERGDDVHEISPASNSEYEYGF